jgi:LacI family transcriptional regulator
MLTHTCSREHKIEKFDFMNTHSTGRRPITLKEVAAHAGVSHMTVSAVLNGNRANRPIALSTREKILQAAQELGYRANGSARAIKAGRFNSLALISSTFNHRSYLPLNLIDGIQDELAAYDMHLVLAKLPDDKLVDEGYIPKILRELMADGLIINYNVHIPQTLVEMIQRYRIPSIWLNAMQESDCIFPDDRGAGSMVTRHLLQLGHTRIAYFVNVTDHYSDAERYAGYENAMREAGLRPWRIVEPDPDFSSWLEQRADWLKSATRPTAIVAYDTGFLLLLLQAACHLGLRVPEDLSLATFRDRKDEVPGLPLCGAVLPEKEMGQMAVRALQNKLCDDSATPMSPQRMQCGFEAGRSAAHPPKVEDDKH